MEPIPHQLFPDLADATVRNRFYGGRDPHHVAAVFPMLPVDAPGLPPPGPSYLSFALELGDQPAPKPVRGRPKPRPSGPYLTALVRNALYQNGTVVPVDNAGERLETLPLPGALFDANDGFVYGPGPCSLMVVGKCIGVAEARSGRPYSGHGSQPLWDAWEELGLPKPGPALPTFMTNLVPFDVPHNVRTLPKDWVLDGLHLFWQQFAACRPKQVLVLGADALKALFGARARVEDYRGRAGTLRMDCRPTVDYPEDVHEAIVTVTDHPAAVSRDPDKFPQFLAGMRFAAAKLGLAERRAEVELDHKPVYTVGELRREVDASVAASRCGGYIAFDAEWEGFDHTHPDSYVYTVQWSHGPGHARCVFLRRCGGAENPDMPPAAAASELTRLLAGAPTRGARLVGHFAKADLPWLARAGVDLYPHYVGAADDPDPDGIDRLFGWQKGYWEGAFDTFVAAHAVAENQPLKLEVIAASKLGVERYDVGVIAWKQRYLKEKKISASKLKGYGLIPEDIILSYGCYDADVAGRLYLYLNGDPRQDTRGALDADEYGNSSREIFAIRMRAWAAAAEIEREGLLVDPDRHRELRELLAAKRDELLAQLRLDLNWVGDPKADPPVPAFDPGRRTHRVDFLFGEEYQEGGVPVRPTGAASLYLEPHKATATTGDGRLWQDACVRAARQGLPRPAPAADKETLIVLSRRHQMVALLKDIDFINTALKGLLRPPVKADEPDHVEPEPDEMADFGAGLDLSDGTPDVVSALNARAEEVFDRGFMYHRCHDGRVRTMLGLVETGRYSSKKPNLQNCSDGVNDQFNRILGWGKNYARKGTPEYSKKFVSRSIMCARPGWRLVGADLKGAEIAIAAWFSGDPLLIDVARRSTLDESDPDYLDAHADLAKRSFGLSESLAEIKEKLKHLRVGAKRARFGHYYGASPETILRKAQEESESVTLEQIQAIVRGHDETHPVLAAFFAAARGRVSRPGHLCNGFGGRRRFRPARDRDLLAAQEREAQNWTCQGLVADAVSKMLGELWMELRLRRLRSRIVLTVHDSIMLECPLDEVALVHDVLLPLCMSERVSIVPTDLDGNPVSGRGPYHFGIDREVFERWGEAIPEGTWRAEVAAAG